MVNMGNPSLTAIAPAKTILLGEHAVNRGQAALAVSVGLYVSCTLTLTSQAAMYNLHVRHKQTYISLTTREAILELGQKIDSLLAQDEYPAIQQIAAADFFAPMKYVLAGLGSALPEGMSISCDSAIPLSSGLGSGGATFIALASALIRLLGGETSTSHVAHLALRGDIVAHGGTASGLDTQTSLYGGAIRYTTAAQAERIPYAQGLGLVIGNTGVIASTGQVNGRVRAWLAEQPVRLHYFQEIGLLARQAEVALREGDWTTLGQLLNLNQLLLERIGVSHPKLETLIDAALTAGALGAKLSGSGGGGIMIALVTPQAMTRVAQAITDAGGAAIVAPVGVQGVQVHEDNSAATR